MKLAPIALGCMLSGLFAIPTSAGTPAPGGSDTFSTTSVHGKIPAANARFVRYSRGELARRSSADEGSLLLHYSDGTVVTVWTAPKGQLTDAQRDAMTYQAGADDVRKSGGGRTVAWAEQYYTDADSGSLPIGLAIYRSGRHILHIRQGQALWDWMFLDNGKRIAMAWAAAHFAGDIDYQLYDVRSGRVIAECFGVKARPLPSSAPRWAKRLQSLMDPDLPPQKPRMEPVKIPPP